LANLENMAPENNNSSSDNESARAMEVPLEVFANSTPVSEEERRSHLSSESTEGDWESAFAVEVPLGVFDKSAPVPEEVVTLVPSAEVMPLEVEVPLPNSATLPIVAPPKTDVFGDWTGLKESTKNEHVPAQQTVDNLTKQKTRFEQALEKGFSGL